MIIKFKIFEDKYGTPDTLELPNNKELSCFDDDARPFEWCEYTGSINLGGYSEGHANLRNRCNNRSYPGRLWEDSKIITFWVFPHEKIFEDMCKSFERVHDIKILNNGWRIVIFTDKGKIKRKSDNQDNFAAEDWWDYDNKIIPVEQYAGSENAPEEEYLMHLQKPIDKKGNAKDRIPGWKPKKYKYQLPGETEVEARNRITKYKYQENVITLFEKFKSSVITIVIDGHENTFNILTENGKVYLMKQDEIYQRLDIKIPDSKKLEEEEFYMSPEVKSEIVTELENQGFIQKINKESLAGDKKVMAYKL